MRYTKAWTLLGRGKTGGRYRWHCFILFLINLLNAFGLYARANCTQKTSVKIKVFHFVITGCGAAEADFGP